MSLYRTPNQQWPAHRCAPCPQALAEQCGALQLDPATTQACLQRLSLMEVLGRGTHASTGRTQQQVAAAWCARRASGARARHACSSGLDVVADARVGNVADGLKHLKGLGQQGQWVTYNGGVGAHCEPVPNVDPAHADVPAVEWY